MSSDASGGDTRRSTIRSRAAKLSRPDVAIELDDETAPPTRTEPPVQTVDAAPVAPAAPLPATTLAPTQTPPPQEAVVQTAVPQPSPPPPPHAASAAPIVQTAPTSQQPARAPSRRARKIHINITDDTTLQLLTILEDELNRARYTENLKGQMGATVLFKLGLLLASQLPKDQLYELARQCSSYQ